MPKGWVPMASIRPETMLRSSPKRRDASLTTARVLCGPANSTRSRRRTSPVPGSGSTASVPGGTSWPITSETTIPGSEEFAYRVTGLGWNGDGPAVTTRVERAFIQPSLTWRPSSDTSLTVLGLYQRDPFSGFYGGFPAFGTVFPRNFGSGIVGRLPVDFYDGDRNFKQSDRTQAAVTYILDHRFDDAFRFHSSGRFLRTEGQYRSVYGAFSGNTPLFPATALTTGPLINRSRIATNRAIA